MAVDSAGIRYEAVEGWERLPAGWSFNDVAGVATDSEDRVYVFNRGEHPVIVFDPEGTVLEAWGEGAFVRPHGMFITPDDRLFLVDDDSHTVYEYTLDGEMKSRIGDGTPSDTGFEPGVSPVARAAGPFNTVTNVAVAPSGEIFACDGYGNARVHKFDADGNHLLSWGEQGSGEGEFNLPHGIALDSSQRVYVADRENSRVQIFTAEGSLLDIWDWVNRPADIYIDPEDTIYICEMGFDSVPEVPHLRLLRDPPPGHDPFARVTICDPDGEIAARIGAGKDPTEPGKFMVPHGIWVDSRGAIYVGEVPFITELFGRYAPGKPRSLQKLARSG